MRNKSTAQIAQIMKETNRKTAKLIEAATRSAGRSRPVMTEHVSDSKPGNRRIRRADIELALEAASRGETPYECRHRATKRPG
jgi:hypothetical protein